MPDKILNTDNIALPLVVTHAGREAAIAADAAGLQLALTQIALGTGLWTPGTDATALQNELKRLDHLGGSASAPDMLHLTVTDDSTDAYALGEFGLYTDSGILFAIFSQATVISEKIADSVLMISADMKLDTVPPGSVTITGNNFHYPPATPDTLGVMTDAPGDGQLYARQSGAWALGFFPGFTLPWPGLLAHIPPGWLHCNGQLLNVADQPALFAVLGTTWGGDGVATFALPPADCFYLPAGSAFAPGDRGGAASATTGAAGDHAHGVTVNAAGDHGHGVVVNATTLTEAQMPSHVHRQVFSQVGGDGADGTKRCEANAELNTWAAGGSQAHAHTAGTYNAGNHTHTAGTASAGGHSHTVDTLPPYAAMPYIIKL